MEFTISTILPVTPEILYKTWLNSEEHTAMTGGEAHCSDQMGASFTAWDGYIEGVNLALVPNDTIIQSWRTTEFSDDEEDSQIEINLDEVDGGTQLTLTHTNLPKHGDQYLQGWEDHYFTPMRAYFS
ncbi:MAG: SRPBCC domain-containing protein [Flavobacteriales bacterium]|nr:SRPBCC domain-containing protein [Flavobacteriales bacterium]